MLRGPRCRLRLEDWGCESPAAAHGCMNMHGGQIFFGSLLSLRRQTHAEVAAERLLNCLFFITPPRRAEHCYSVLLAVAFLHTVSCLCSPGAVTFGLLAAAQGKFAQSLWYEVRPSREMVTRRKHIWQSLRVCVSVAL